MKAWKNAKGNWCFEFENDEKECLRLSVLASEAVASYHKRRRSIPESFISASLLSKAISTVFMDFNYGKINPTVDKPFHISAKILIKDIIDSQEKGKWMVERYTRKEIEIMKKESFLEEL